MPGPAQNSPAPAVQRVSGDEPAHLRPVARVPRPEPEAALPVAQANAQARPGGGQVAVESSSDIPNAYAAGAEADPAITDSGEFAASLPDPLEDRVSTRPGREASRIQRSRIGPVQIGLGVAVLAIVVLAVLFKRGHFRGAILTEQDPVVLTEIENRTGDKALDGVVATGLQFALAESPYLRLDSAVSYLTARRQVDASAADAPAHVLARNTAQKLHAKAYLFGQITGSAAPYKIHLDLLDTASNDILATVEEPLPSLDQLPAVIDRVATALRTSVGESSDSVSKFSTPIASEATGNPEALRAFEQGESDYVSGRSLDALHDYQQAVSLEPKFVQAHLQLVVLYRKLRAEVAAADAAKQALAATDASSPHTKAIAQYEFEMNSTGDYPFAVSIIRQFSSAHPHDADALEKLARALRLEGRVAEALQTAEEATNEDPYNLEAWIQTENSLIGLDRYDAAAQADTQAQRLGLPHDGGALTAAYLGGREEVLASAIAQSQSRKGGFRPDWNYGIYLDNVGHLAAAGALWRSRADQALEMAGLQSAGAFLLSQSAYDRALLGDCGAALEFAKEADSHPEGLTALFNVGMADALCGNSARATEIVTALQQSYPQSFAVRGFYVADIKAGIALHEQNPSAALDLLKPAQQYDLISLTPLLRGRAHVELHQVQIGIVDFQTVLAHRGVPFIVGSVSYPVAQIGVARAFADTGDVGNSANAYRRFLELWKTADPGQPLVAEARTHSR
jgi:tetratricopeptide (TPR) repeat protein